jgi:hypothetical protein
MRECVKNGFVGSLLLSATLVLTTGSVFGQDHSFTSSSVFAANAATATLDATSGATALSVPEDANAAEASPPVAIEAVEPNSIVSAPQETSHPFWDRENKALFATVGAAATADFFTTRANLASGGRELNPIARIFASSTPALAANFGMETAGVIAISYVFHKTGHHKLERLTSFIDVGGSLGAVTYGLTHR